MYYIIQQQPSGMQHGVAGDLRQGETGKNEFIVVIFFTFFILE
jgi:hypothetical protein